MGSRRQTVATPGREAPGAPRRGPARLTQAEVALALQRTAGNAATGAVLARQPAPAAQLFNLLIVDDGKTGLDPATLTAALAAVQSELKVVTDGSTNPSVKAGFGVQVVQGLEKGKPRDLGKRSFVVFLIGDKDSAKAYDLADEHIRLDARERGTKEKHIRSQIAAEGGINLEWVPLNPKKPSQSVAFVGTDRPVKMQADKRAGPANAGQYLGDVILHELAHAAGHSEHDKGGLMTETRIIDSSGRYLADHFSKASAKRIRERLEWLAGL